MEPDIKIGAGDALIVVDVQEDFLPGGAIAIARGNEVVAPLNRWIRLFSGAQLPVVATRDWHPADHCSFKPFGGPWPAHCVAGTGGAAFSADIDLPIDAIIVSKGTRTEREAYSGFDGTALESELKSRGVRRLFVGGLATEYCVLSTVKDAVVRGFSVFLLQDSVRAVNLEPDDGERAEQAMKRLGARPIALEAIAS